MNRARDAGTLAALVLAGCFGTSNLPPQEHYVLQDLATVQPAAAASPRTLLVAATSSGVFYDSQSLAFSRAPGSRAHYQFASWTERPGRRFSALLVTRLARRASFSQVAATTAGVRGDLILNTSIDEIYHDDAAPPGRARVAVTAELVDRASQTLVARRVFAHEAPVERDDAAGAVAGFDRAVTALLDELVAWVESEAARR